MRYAWCWSTAASIRPCGRPSNPLRPRSVVFPRPCMNGSKHEIDTGMRDGVTSAERERVKALEREVRGTAPSQRDSEDWRARFSPRRSSTADSSPERSLSTSIGIPIGVEPICKVLQIAPSGYRRYAAQQRNPALRCARARRDDMLNAGNSTCLASQYAGLRR